MENASLHSPNELLKAGKDRMLDGKEPETREDWVRIVNFWAACIHPDTQPVSVQLMCKLYNAPVTDDEAESICMFQAVDRILQLAEGR